MYSFPALLTLLPLILFTTGEITGCAKKAAKGANKVPRNPCFCFSISCFTVSVTPSINTTEFSSDFFMILIITVQNFSDLIG